MRRDSMKFIAGGHKENILKRRGSSQGSGRGTETVCHKAKSGEGICPRPQVGRGDKGSPWDGWALKV